MAQNIPISDANSTVDGVAADLLSTLNTVDVSGASPRIWSQYIKLLTGPSGSGTDVSAANPIPASLSGTLAIGTALPSGTNTLGTVNVGTGPAAARTTDSISAGLETDAIMNGLTAIAPAFAAFDVCASGATQVVPSLSGSKVRVLRWDIVCNGAVTVKWQSHVTPTNITGRYPFAANGGKESGFCPVGHFQTNTSEALDINCSSATSVGGSVTYIYI